MRPSESVCVAAVSVTCERLLTRLFRQYGPVYSQAGMNRPKRAPNCMNGPFRLDMQGKYSGDGHLGGISPIEARLSCVVVGGLDCLTAHMEQRAREGATEQPLAGTQHDHEPHDRGTFNDGLNKLRAGVLGANDGIVSVAAVVVGVAGATTELAPIITAGAAAVVGGAISMALGEYVSVASARDSQTALIAKEKRELAEMPEQELAELAGIYQAKGLSAATAQKVAEELTAHDALGAHLEAELHIDEHEVLKPWQAAWASFLAFLLGAVLPMLAIVLPPAELRIPITFLATLLALGITGALGAYLGKSPWLKPTLRVVLGGAVALAVTFAIGALLGTAIA